MSKCSLLYIVNIYGSWIQIPGLIKFVCFEGAVTKYLVCPYNVENVSR
jgi:hypothetical protein